MCDMDDQNTKYVIASKGRKVVYLSLNLQQHQGMQPIWKVHLKGKLILDWSSWIQLVKIGRMYLHYTFQCMERPNLPLVHAQSHVAT